uniref:Putative disease resistance protein RGA4 n=1 Tax=Solanum bulbocastanum TaxID=147425 RepID=RGA4_SOLBU|nr:RecName: Full=Putative disease resistance protein RGA4; AltName: Full=RGA4-blb [Solanum bulbocastanum]AAP45166.1 Putative disease resistance protein RGA4, identical [Solanum bulbocastanum]
MAEAFLQVLLENLTSFIGDKLVLIFGFEKECEKLSSVFSTIQAVLQDAQEKQLKDKAIENWLQKLNSAAYEVDDILGECKNEAIRFEQSRLGFYHPGIINFRHKIGRRMKEIMEKLDAISEERRKFHFLEKITERQAAAATRETGFVLTEPKVYGRDKEEDEIVKILINNVNVAEELPVFPIIGMGGLGKTTLAQMIFNDERVTKHFNPKIWVCVSDDFDEKRLIKTIIGNIERSSPHVEDLASFQKKLQELLNGKRYLLVLDDVWNDDLEKWAKLRAVLTVGARGASILATTRLEKVGSIMGTLQPYHLSNLSPHDSLLLFMQRAFGQQKEANPNLVAIGKEIVKKCGGVPLAAKTLGGLLRFKREESEWEHVRDNEIWSLPQDESSILPALRLSYHHLPLDLRQCFAYCAVFPKDTKMIKENLITLWMAHGFLLSKGNLELEDVGNEVWNELYLRSFFQEIEAKSGNTYFKIHDLIHDLATSLFSASASCGNIREINVKDYKHTVSIGFAAVVSSYSPSLLKKFVSLRVLNLSYSKLEQLPSSIGDLLHLRYLDLSCNNFRSLPERLCKLQNLQTLDVHNCYSLNCLPKQTSKLSSLRHLVVDGCPLTSTPPRIGLLTCLKTLGFFIVGSKKGYQLGELKNLNLCGSISITHLERVKNDTDAEANLSAKANLQSLSMSWDNDGPNRYESKEVKVLEALKPHPNLKYLEIIAFGGFRFPSWINHSVLEKVISVRIKSCKNCLCLPPFGELPCLENLELQNGSAEVEYVEEDDVHSRFSTRRSFPSLKKLRIWFFRSLKGLMKEEGEEKFPMLEEMAILYCPLFVFPTLSSVKKLEVHGNTNTRGLSSISNLSTLTSLRIGANYRATSLPEEMFTSLTNLEFLSFFDFKNLKDLPTSLTSLNALKRLQIESCDSLESFPEQGLEGLTSLTQLFVKYCKMLKCLPEGLQHLTALTNLGVSGCPEVEKRCDKEIGEDWHKIAHIPNLDIH